MEKKYVVVEVGGFFCAFKYIDDNNERMCVHTYAPCDYCKNRTRGHTLAEMAEKGRKEIWKHLDGTLPPNEAAKDTDIVNAVLSTLIPQEEK